MSNPWAMVPPMPPFEIPTPEEKDHLLDIYEREGASAAARAGDWSKRTIQRWAAARGVSSGYTPPPLKECPSVAAFVRGCKCEECAELNRERQKAAKARRVERFRAGKVKIKHGIGGYSNWDCRCPKCRQAWRQYLQGRRVSRRKEEAEAEATS